MGRVVGAFGVRGYIRVMSYTVPVDNLLNYLPWFLDQGGRCWPVEPTAGHLHGAGLIVKLPGYDDRDRAQALSGALIQVAPTNLPRLPDGEYYWYQLAGLKVMTCPPDSGFLGRVERMMATGANDVMVVSPCPGSLDDRERLLPYLPGRVIQKVCLEEGLVEVDWDTAF